MENILRNTLANDGFIMVNKHLIKSVGLEASALLGDLYSKESYFKQRGELYYGSFFNTRENIQNDLGLTPHQQRKAEQKLIDAGMLKVESKPQIINGKAICRKVNYYTLNHKNILDVMNKDIDTRTLKSLTSDNQDIEQQQYPINNTQVNNNHLNNNRENKMETLGEPRIPVIHKGETRVYNEWLMNDMKKWETSQMEKMEQMRMEYYG